jgi:hypothetical protein
MSRLERFSSVIGLLASALALAACSGGDDGDDGSAGGAGTVAEPWTDFCTGTFSEDTEIIDVFGEPQFTARAGQTYLLSEWNDSFGGLAQFVYLTSGGPDSFEVEPSADGSWPFTSNCMFGAGVPYYAVFADVTIYAEEALATELCSLSAGTALPSPGGLRGYALAGDLSFEGPATYELYLDAFSAQCGGSDRGYISVPETRSFGADTRLVPVISIIGPS